MYTPHLGNSYENYIPTFLLLLIATIIDISEYFRQGKMLISKVWIMQGYVP